MISSKFNFISLTSIDLSNFNTLSLIKSNSLFYNCTNLLSLDLSKFDTSNTEEFFSMFSESSKIAYINLRDYVGKDIFSLNLYNL